MGDRQAGDLDPLIEAFRRLKFRTAPSEVIEAGKREICRSVSKKLVKTLKKLKCTCGERFSNINLPVIAYCGHYVCASHENEVLDNDNEFVCIPCRNKNFPKRDSFLRDIALEDFYHAIKEPGYRCQECDECHPRENSVYSLKHLKPHKPPFLCVWCAVKGNNFEKYDVRSIENEDGQEKDVDLKSLDRTRHPSGWSLFECGVCKESLLKEENATWPKSIVHLGCNHISHKQCSDAHKGTTIICKLCNFKTEKSAVQKRKSHASDYFQHLNQDAMYLDCYIPGKCLQRHPESNTVPFGEKVICVWCYLGFLEDGRLMREDELKKKKTQSRFCSMS